ncbi:MAG: DUF2950 domain-containing protein [Syntrophobacteraceae bacterium]
MSALINRKTNRCCFAALLLALALLISPGFCSLGLAASKGAKHFKQKVFSSPQLAVNAFVAALKNKDAKELRAIFGAGSYDLIHSGDKVADNQARERALKMFAENNKIDQVSERKAVLDIGKDNWPFPIPIVKQKGKWRFDTRAGRLEILDRRIGRNELGAIKCCEQYVKAQKAYASQLHDNSGLFEYAQKFISSAGKKNGLYWKTSEGRQPSPLSAFMENAIKIGYGAGEKGVFEGYRYNILTGQGKNAQGGAFSYVNKGKMTGGFAMIAYPAKYGVSGVMTFIVNNQGVVYQKDLGPRTASRARAIKLFNPDKSWSIVK